jgi:methylmalonyl-CoA mutase
VQGIAISSYQGGHVEYFKYMVDLLRQRGGAHIQVFGGGGGVIVPAEIRELQAYGVARIYSPEDGQRMGLAGHDRRDGDALRRTCRRTRRPRWPRCRATAKPPGARWPRPSPRWRTARPTRAGQGRASSRRGGARSPVLGITGTGGAGKSSLTDELIRRLRLDQGDALRIAVISIDPSRRKSGGALLGDRIRMNAIGPWQRPARLHAQPGHARLRQRDQPGAARRADRPARRPAST